MKSIKQLEILSSMFLVGLIAFFGFSLLLRYADLFLSNVHKLI